MDGYRDVGVGAAVDDGLDAVRRQAVAVCLVCFVLPHNSGDDARHLQQLCADGVGVASARLVHARQVSLAELLIRLAISAAHGRRSVGDADRGRQRRDNSVNRPRGHIPIWSCLKRLDRHSGRAAASDGHVLQSDEALIVARLHDEACVDRRTGVAGDRDAAGRFLRCQHADADKRAQAGQADARGCVDEAAVVDVLGQLPGQTGKPREDAQEDAQRAANGQVDGAAEQLLRLYLEGVQQICIARPQESAFS